DIVDDVRRLRKKHDLVFDLYRVAKADHAIISFFDQVFDQGLNPSVPWNAYWTPLRYVFLLKLATWFDEAVARDAWTARITVDKQKADALLTSVCTELLTRLLAEKDP